MYKKSGIMFLLAVFSLFFMVDVALAVGADRNILTEVVNEFHKQASNWYGIAQKFTLNLFYLLAMLEIAYIGIQTAIGLSDIKETLTKFVFFILTAGFFLAVINNYNEWSMNIIRGLQSLAGSMVSPNVNSSNPFLAGLEMFQGIWDKIGSLDVGLIIIAGISAIVILACFALITARIILVKCEAIICMMAGLILIAFGATSFLKDYAVNAIRYIFSVGFKLFTLELVIGIGFSFIETITAKGEVDLGLIGLAIGFSIVLLAITLTLPETVAGIINGAHVGSMGGAEGRVARGAAGMAMGGVGAVAGGAMAANTARQVAKQGGASGFVGMAKGTMGAMRDAYHQGKVNKTSMNTQLKETLNTLKAK